MRISDWSSDVCSSDLESLYASLQHNESKQNFNVWVYGDEKLVRGSGLFVGDTGIVANHHFLLPKNDNNFKFQSGTYCLEVHASILGDKRTKMLFSEVFEIYSRSEEHTSELQSIMRISNAVYCLQI